MLDKSLNTFRFINYLLIALIIVTTLLLTRNILSISFSKKRAGASTTVQRTSTNDVIKIKNIMNYADILERNPFGPSMQLHPIAAPQETITGTGSISELVLIGTVVGPEKLNYAIFKDKSGASSRQEDVFALGDMVFSYGKLIKVENNSVEIEQESSIHKLTIPYDKISAPAEQSRSRSSGKSRRSFARKVSEREYIVDRQTVQQSISNPEHIMTDARLLPNFVNGKQEGFIISEVKPDGLYDHLGLKNGDVLLKVNGLEMSNPEVAIQAMSALKGMNRVNLAIIRSGENMSMSYQLR